MTNSSMGNRSDKSRDLFKGMTKTSKAKVDKKAARPPIHVGEHGRYQIKSGLLSGEFVARAFAKAPHCTTRSTRAKLAEFKIVGKTRTRK